MTSILERIYGHKDWAETIACRLGKIVGAHRDRRQLEVEIARELRLAKELGGAEACANILEVRAMGDERA